MPSSQWGRRQARGAAVLVGVALPFVFVLGALASDTTPPVVKFAVKQAGHYKVVKSTTISDGEPLTLRAVAEDSQGVRKLTISFPPVTSSSCTVGGAIYTGSFPITLPSSRSVSTSGVHVKLVKDVAIPYPTCEVPGNPSQHGFPIGHAFTVVATAINRSSNSSVNQATATLKVKIQ